MLREMLSQIVNLQTLQRIHFSCGRCSFVLYADPENIETFITLDCYFKWRYLNLNWRFDSFLHLIFPASCSIGVEVFETTLHTFAVSYRLVLIQIFLSNYFSQCEPTPIRQFDQHYFRLFSIISTSTSDNLKFISIIV